MNYKKQFFAAVAGTAVIFFTASVRADLVQNGSFEAPTVAGNFDTSVPDFWDVLGAAGFNNPIVAPSSIDHIGGYWQAADGLQSLDMNGLEYGVIGQTLNTVVGQKYQVQFALSGNPEGGPFPKSIQVDVIANPATSSSFLPYAPVAAGTDGNPIALAGVISSGSGSGFIDNVNLNYEDVFSFAGGNSKVAMNWQIVQFSFVATSTTEYLQFTSRTVDYSGNSSYPTGFGPALDAVSVVPVPLPASVGVGFSMLGAFGGLFAFRKRLSRKVCIVGTLN